MKYKGRDLTELKTQVIKLYNEGKHQNFIEGELNLCSHTVRKYLKQENLPSRCYRKNYFNEDYFEKIDSEDKAYFLGLLYADGNVYLKRRRTQITLQNEDCYILEKFKEYLQCSTKLYSDRGRYGKLILDSDKLSQDLIKLGCVPNKSLILKFPTEEQVSKELIHHFIRGYFDGDGSVSIYKTYVNINFTSNESFLLSLSEILKTKNIESSKFRKRYKDHIDSAGSISIGKRESQILLKNFIYDNCKNLYLKRKFEKFKYLL